MATGPGLEFEISNPAVVRSAFVVCHTRHPRLVIGMPSHFLFLFTLLRVLNGSLFRSHWSLDSRLMPLLN
jgi:hypothetical protein